MRIMWRIAPALHAEAIRKKGCRTVEMGGRPYAGYVYVGGRDKNPKDFEYWIGLALEFNKRTKASSRKKN